MHSMELGTTSHSTLNACNLPLLHSFDKGKFCHQHQEIPQAETYIAKSLH